MCYHRALYVLVLNFIVIPATVLADDCWFAVGNQSMYGSYEQGLELKKRAEANPSCNALGISWQIDLSRRGGRGIRYSFLVWDSESKGLWRVHSHLVLGGWESWANVTRHSIAEEDYSDGFDFGGYRSGSGLAPLSEAARKLARRNDKAGRFKNSY